MLPSFCAKCVYVHENVHASFVCVVLSIAFLNFPFTLILNHMNVHKVDSQHLATVFSLIVWEEGTRGPMEGGAWWVGRSVIGASI